MADQEPAAAKRRSPTRMAIGVLVSLVLVVAIFYFLLRDIDLRLVWAEIRAMTWIEDAILAVLAAWNLATATAWSTSWATSTPSTSVTNDAHHQGNPRRPRHSRCLPRPGGRLAGQPRHRPVAGAVADEDLMVEGMLRNIEAGETFIVWDDDDTPAATITINTWAKPELWTEQERAEPALYAHKVTVDRAYGGQGLGAELLDWAGTRAADEGADWLRVDVWTTNERLQHYYLKQGFTYARTVVLPHNPSGALFQRPAQRVPTPRLQEIESLTG